MGEHYGHVHLPDREERLFLLDYFPLMLTPMDKWLIHFRHAGVFLMTHTNTMLRKKARQFEFRTEPLIVVGFMNEQQLRILKKFQSTICLENHGNWIVMYSLAVRADDRSKPPLAFPVAYCFSNFMDGTIIAEFFLQIKKRTGVLDCVLVVSNNEKIFAGAWAKAFSESRSIFMQSWQDLVDKIIFSRNQLDYDEAIEMEEILRTAICRNFPNVTNITKEFSSAAIHSKKLNVDIYISLSNRERQESLFELLDEWVGELIAVGFTKSFRDKMFWSENYYINRAIMSDHVPKVMMHLTLHFRHVLNNSPPLGYLENFVCSIE